MCANVYQMCTKVLTTDITDILLFWEVQLDGEWQRLIQYVVYIQGYSMGHTPYTRYLYLSFASEVALKFA